MTYHKIVTLIMTKRTSKHVQALLSETHFNKVLIIRSKATYRSSTIVCWGLG